MRAKVWICSRISALEGRSLGLTSRRQRRLAALRLAVKYSDSALSYISRAASRAIACRSLPFFILSCADIIGPSCGAGPLTFSALIIPCNSRDANAAIFDQTSSRFWHLHPSPLNRESVRLDAH